MSNTPIDTEMGTEVPPNVAGTENQGLIAVAAAPPAAAAAEQPAAQPAGSREAPPHPENRPPDHRTFFGRMATYQPTPPELPRLRREKIKSLGDCWPTRTGPLGKVDLIRYPVEGQGTVVLKHFPTPEVTRLRSQERNPLAAEEDPENELGSYLYIQSKEPCPWILRLLGAFQDVGRTFFVLEACQCDLLDHLQDAATNGLRLSPARYMWQLLNAVDFLHRHGIAHRDISLENILYKPDGDQIRLMDFGQACPTVQNGKYKRYFQYCGKPGYKAPEMYVPANPAKPVGLQVPEGYQPGTIVQVQCRRFLPNVCFVEPAVPNTPGVARFVGYYPALLDIFQCGVAFYTLHCQANVPWMQGNHGGMAWLGCQEFSFVHDNGIGAQLDKIRKPLREPGGVELMQGLLNTNARDRWPLNRCLQSEYFAAQR